MSQKTSSIYFECALAKCYGQFGYLARHSWGTKLKTLGTAGAQLGHKVTWCTVGAHSGHTSSLDTVGALLGHKIFSSIADVILNSLPLQ